MPFGMSSLDGAGCVAACWVKLGFISYGVFSCDMIGSVEVCYA